MSVTEIGRRLKKARLDAGLTQKEVSNKLGITYQAVSSYERGINRVDTDTLSRLCQIYGVEIGDLLRTPAWDADMLNAYRQAKTDKERQSYIELWGCPAELIEAENERREPDTNPLSPDEEIVLRAYHDGKIPFPLTQGNVVHAIGRDGKMHKKVLTDKGYEALIAVLDALEDVPDGT